ncbi:MAG: ATP-binding protein [bacterium]|nr:ATP-binding protein [bacterium]
MEINPLSYFFTTNKNAELIKQATKELYSKNLELIKERRRLDKVLNSVRDGIIGFDKFGRISIFNQFASNLFKLDPDKVLEKEINSVVTFRLNGQKIDIFKDSFKVPQPQYMNSESLDYSLTVSCAKSSKEIFIALSVSIVDEDVLGQEVILSFYDLSEFKKLSDLKTDIISITSHELRTPMTVVKNYLWMLVNDKKDKLSKVQSGYINKAIQNSGRMLSLINDMLNVSRIEQGKLMFVLEKFAIQDEIFSIKDDMEARKGDKKIKLIFTVPKTPIKIYSDKVKFSELIVNLVTNSIKYTNEGEIELSVTAKPTTILVQIRDTGVGIPLVKQKELFVKFGRLNSSFVDSAKAGGTGLGLYISKQYVDGLGGKIGVISEGEQKGSIFWFEIPIKSKIESEIVDSSKNTSNKLK